MTHQIDYLTKLKCAAGTARDYGYVHTGRALDRMIVAEQQRLRLRVANGMDDPPATQTPIKQ